MHPEVSIILLNWNGWQDTIECLESLYQIDYPAYNIIVVDNDSRDDSLEKIRAYCKGEMEAGSKFTTYSSSNKPVEIFEFDENELESSVLLNSMEEIKNKPSARKLILIKNLKNYGFAKGNNIGIKFALEGLVSPYTMLLNNDTVVDKNFLQELVKVAESDDEIALVGSKIYYYDFNGKDDQIWCVGGKIDLNHYPGHYAVLEDVDIGSYQEPTLTVDWVSGAAMLIKAAKVPYNYLDEDFFFGCEDADLALKLHEQGFKAITALDSIVWHKIGASRKKGKLFKTTLSEIKTSLKFIKAHKKGYSRHLPLYYMQIISFYLSAFFNRIF
nr:glycosyltransferase family 2 protein [uncultured Methanobacterium sp.]